MPHGYDRKVRGGSHPPAPAPHVSLPYSKTSLKVDVRLRTFSALSL
jgi:hypothetical protein